MKKTHITAVHPTKGERRFSAGIWAAMGADKAGFVQVMPMPEELKFPKGGQISDVPEAVMPSDKMIKRNAGLIDQINTEKQPKGRKRKDV